MALKPMHKPRVGSLGTNASGISNISNVASLSQFPEPPDSIPSISLRLDPYHTPSAPHSPATPSRSYPGTPISGRSAPRRKQSANDHSQYPFGPNFSSSSAAQGDFTYNDYEGSTTPPIASGSTAPLRRKHHTPERSTTMSSRGEQHEGASQSIVDDNEDRMPSTSFITGVLSSADHTARSHTPIDMSSSSHLAYDGMSSISEISYPPRSGAFRTPPAADPMAPASPSNYSQKPSGTFLTMDDDQSAVGSTLTVDSYGVGGSVIRTASMSKKLGARGASVVGYASGTIKRVASTSKSPTSPIHREKRREPRSSSPIPDDECDAQRMALSDFRTDHDAASYSPARRSSVGFHPGDHSTGRGVAPLRESKSGSFFSNLTSSFGGWFAPKSHNLARTTAYPFTPDADEAAYKSKEDNLRLPQLVSRADALEGMLAQGRRPHHSIDTHASAHRRPVVSPWDSKYREDMTARHTYVSSHVPSPSGSWPTAANGNAANMLRLTRRRKGILGITLLLIAIALGVGLGIGLPKKHTPVTCPVGLAGNSCTLNSTCVCTSTQPGQCDALSQNLINLIPTMNDLFVANYTPNMLSDAVWAAQGAPPANQCQSQAVIVDVAPALDDMSAPNRTLWAQSALLWNFIQSQNTAALDSMQEFIVDAPWGDLSQADGPVSDGSNKFVVSLTGFKFDFAAQTVTPPNITFASNGNPSSAQAAQVASTASSALDRMYSFALASSTQRQQPLQSYWAGALAQNSDDLSTFTSAISTAPILLPFDATASPISALLTNSTTSPFPVPLACYPNLNTTQLQLLNDVETIVYGLQSASVTSQVDTSCFPDRPLYGILDILHLRQPFVDSRTGVARQAAALQSDVAPRAIIHSGEVLSALPGTPLTSGMPVSEAIDPRQYGTTNHLNHVLLNFLSSIPDISVAIALVEFVLSGSSVPPANNTTLYNALDSIPALEVAIFGTVTPNDVSSVVSSFATPSGGLFFGSNQSLSVRDWAINGANSSIQWSQYSASSEVVRDTSLSSSTFDSVWTPAYEWFHITTSQVVTVATIVGAFQATGQFAA